MVKSRKLEKLIEIQKLENERNCILKQRALAARNSKLFPHLNSTFASATFSSNTKKKITLNTFTSSKRRQRKRGISLPSNFRSNCNNIKKQRQHIRIKTTLKSEHNSQNQTNTNPEKSDYKTRKHTVPKPFEFATAHRMKNRKSQSLPQHHKTNTVRKRKRKRKTFTTKTHVLSSQNENALFSSPTSHSTGNTIRKDINNGIKIERKQLLSKTNNIEMEIKKMKQKLRCGKRTNKNRYGLLDRRKKKISVIIPRISNETNIEILKRKKQINDNLLSPVREMIQDIADLAIDEILTEDVVGISDIEQSIDDKIVKINDRKNDTQNKSLFSPLTVKKNNEISSVKFDDEYDDGYDAKNTSLDDKKHEKKKYRK
eukprot:494249_1